MKARIVAQVLSVGDRSIVFTVGGETLTLAATEKEEQAFGALLYQDVIITIDVEPVAAS